MKSTLNGLLTVVLAAAVITSCGPDGYDGRPDSESLIVRKERGDRWEILSRDNSETALQARFDDEPSIVVNGFFSARDGGSLALYRLKGGESRPVDHCGDLLCAGAFVEKGIAPMIDREADEIKIIDTGGNTRYTLSPIGGDDVVGCASAFYDDMLIAVNAEGLVGAYDSDGRLKVPFAYKDMTVFNDGVAVATYGEAQTFVIDRQGDVVCDISKYSVATDAYPFSLPRFVGHRLAVYDTSLTPGFINPDGDFEPCPANVVAIKDFNSDKYVFEDRNGRRGVNDFDGETLVGPRHDAIFLLPDGKYLVADKGEISVADDDADHGKIQMANGFGYAGRSPLVSRSDGSVKTLKRRDATRGRDDAAGFIAYSRRYASQPVLFSRLADRSLSHRRYSFTNPAGPL